MTFLQRKALLALALMAATPAMADDHAPRHPLKPGKAAGVSHAQEIKSGVALVAAGGVVAVVALVASTGGGTSTAKPQTNAMPVTGTP